MKIDEGKVLLLLTGILTGIVVISFLVNASAKPIRFLTFKQYQNMKIELNQLKAEVKGLYNEYGELDKKLYEYKTGGSLSQNVVDTQKKELDMIKKFYGNSNVEGPGIKITINDRIKSLYFDEDDIYNSITHNTDLLYAVTDLRNAGAEAISINGQRILSTTAITCEGPTIEINNENVIPPFEILAIGDPDALLYAVSSQESHFEEIRFRKLPLTIEKMDNIKILGN
jgi:uncharacterized protein YlxW (UPF0749 family)